MGLAVCGLKLPQQGLAPPIDVVDLPASDPALNEGANMDLTDFPADKLAEIYIKIRDKRDKLKAEYEEQHKVLQEQLDIVEAEMLELCRENGADSIKTPAGLIMRRVDTRFWTNDWDSFYEFVNEHDAYALFEKRIHQGNMKQFMEENPDLLPKGLMSDSKYKITVRRSK